MADPEEHNTFIELHDHITKKSSQVEQPPSFNRVKFGQALEEESSGLEPRPLFSELQELRINENGFFEWNEKARWVKYEEAVEKGGNRWSKPHVSSLSLNMLFELQSMLAKGSVMLDMNAGGLDDITNQILEDMVSKGILPAEKKNFIGEAILAEHKHLHETTKKDKFGEGGKSKSSGNFSRDPSLIALKSDRDESNKDGKMNTNFMKKLAEGTEAASILVGEHNRLQRHIMAFVRLAEPVLLTDLTEVPVPTRFIFLLLGPKERNGSDRSRFHELGRGMATMLSDKDFSTIAYKATSIEHILGAVDEFLEAATVLPQAVWDPNIRIEPPSSAPNRKSSKPVEAPKDEEEEAENLRKEAGLVRTGRLFGGLINDIKRKKPWYWSDFKDALSMQCFASFIFIYFATLTPTITFGGLLGEVTENRLASIESLIAGIIVGLAYGFFAGQPLTILGSTGPVLIYEAILYEFCDLLEWEYLPFRLLIGIWVGILLILMVAFDLSAFVCYITRFTEENFATLIAFIFIVKPLGKLYDIGRDTPLHPSECFCKTENLTVGTSKDFIGFDPIQPYKYPCNFILDGETFTGLQSAGCHYVPNAFTMSVILLFGTFIIAFGLKNFKSTGFFSARTRQIISDFSVIIAIVIMTAVDYLAQVDTFKLDVPSTLRPTWRGRGWLIAPFGSNPIWSIALAFVAALVATILIFMDQQITAVIVNRKENKMVKGTGYHLDLLIVAIMIIVCSIFGLPWFVGETVLSVNHVQSLAKESESNAPGEKPQFLGTREQRVTHLLIFLFIGLSIFMAPVLKVLPMPVLYGIFLYMGVASLNGIQFFDRILLFFMPKKYQPDYPYLRRVPLKRVHLFTLVQLICLAALWTVKSVKVTAIFFPLMLVIMMGVRKLLDFVFSKEELKILDDNLPDYKRKERQLAEENSRNIVMSAMPIFATLYNQAAVGDIPNSKASSTVSMSNELNGKNTKIQ